MEKQRIVISGIGVLSSCGIGREAFWDSVFAGSTGIKPVSLFDTTGLDCHLAGEIKDFSPQEFLGPKGLRNLDRTTKLIMSAAKLAMDDAALVISEENSRDIGIAVGSTLGSVGSICDFDTESINDGPNLVNPALFPNTVINAPASQVSIKFNIRGFNTTISTGFTAGLDAINYGVDMLRSGKAKIVLAGGVESLSFQTFLGFCKSGCVLGTEGMAIGEGACLLVLEGFEQAQSRRAQVFAQVSGFGMGSGYSAEGLEQSMKNAMSDAGCQAGDIDCIYACANSGLKAGAYETAAINRVFGERAHEIKVTSIKPLTGEMVSASGAVQAAAAVGSIKKQRISGMVLVNNTGPGSGSSSLILKKLDA